MAEDDGEEGMTYEEWGKFPLLKDFGLFAKMYADWTADRDYQRRHRKWALEKARGITAGYYYWKRLAEEGVLIAAALTNRAEAAEAERDRLRKERNKYHKWWSECNDGQARAEECGDKLAERVRVLEEALRQLVRVCTPEPEGKLRGIANLDTRIAWYDELCPVRERARAALSESSTKMEEEG
jgi:hypothetical protein